jgi:hypothetical protein
MLLYGIVSIKTYLNILLTIVMKLSILFLSYLLLVESILWSEEAPQQLKKQRDDSKRNTRDLRKETNVPFNLDQLSHQLELPGYL